MAAIEGVFDYGHGHAIRAFAWRAELYKMLPCDESFLTRANGAPLLFDFLVVRITNRGVSFAHVFRWHVRVLWERLKLILGCIQQREPLT
jgi:hypothetical protein